MKTYHYSEIDSTNSQLRRLIVSGEADNFMIVTADYQTAGRGQVGNCWESENNKNLLFSILLRPQSLDVRLQYYLSMAISVAVVAAISPIVASASVKVKWPNDIYVGDKKLAGILIENTLRETKIGDCIVGIGLNVNQDKFLSDAPNPVSMLNITGREHDISLIAESIRRHMMLALDDVNNQRWSDIISAYMSILYRYDGEFHPFRDPQGDFMARISAVEPDGHIHLIDEKFSERIYTFKEVEFII
ncbi:MAG: biotin--[acetyl-CoA-carboxylase] ligase [Bacteroidales bacterium]|nr:biotin--[acetyl-CoA-carboxylase] ligase [Bacteroidales bacterium]